MSETKVFSKYEIVKSDIERFLDRPHYVKLLREPLLKNQIALTYFCGKTKKDPFKLVGEISESVNHKLNVTWFSMDVFNVLRMRIEAEVQ